jgi:hypothetical protein
MDWKNSGDNLTVRGVAAATEAKWKALGQSRGSYLPTLYMNDASRDQNPLASYPTANVQRLRQISQKYDPKQIFQRLQNNGFLLSRI